MTQQTHDHPLQTPEMINEVTKAIDDASEELRALNLEIFNNPEACKLLSEWLENRRWSVHCGVYGIKTTFKARFSVKEGGRTVYFNAKYDTLSTISHTCSHNLITTSALFSAISLKSILKAYSIPGILGFDSCVIIHRMLDFSIPVCYIKASLKLHAKFRGIILLRQYIQKSESIQRCILKVGKIANIIPDYAEGLFSVRAITVKGVEKLRERMERVFQGVAEATGCKVELEWFALYEDVVTNDTLAEQYRQYMLQYLGLQPEQMVLMKEARMVHDSLGSSDFGSCSYICPGIQAMFNIKASDLPHLIGFREAAQGDIAHEKALRAGKANTLIFLDMLTNDAFTTRMKDEFRAAMKEAGRLSE
ncbi:hypothetical protein BO94DRAFT_561504 [Aspergillus sclerotioniger CBS 115572]|uniref:Peptidase M20 domain-containing protein 2 n=1 Tax=Aspergillus sclerotioniger CBS 115572 TaxID=1450535 RepID=A0A317UYU6_9EURO|nr:hypothetical protein BO94DRAFT_561504 [Aspergillus sclerotioniger CBS 115572]PWY65672.1 hypothetical protein BO94DRAFT_561504 [Aspergillus sclerotioniger CBS 115572]